MLESAYTLLSACQPKIYRLRGSALTFTGRYGTSVPCVDARYFGVSCGVEDSTDYTHTHTHTHTLDYSKQAPTPFSWRLLLIPELNRVPECS